MRALSPAEKEAVLVEVQSRVLAAKDALTERDPNFDLAAVINDALYHERRRLDTHRGSPTWKSDAAFWKGVSKRLSRASERELRDILGSVIHRYLGEIIGNFDPKVYGVATKVIPYALSGLLNTMSPTRLLSGFDSLASLDDHLIVRGELDTISKLIEIGTVILVPTHLSNMDSPVIGYSLFKVGLPPFTYGAGLNLFTNPIIGYFMHNLGAYKVDRLKKDDLYKDTLKEYATYTLEMGIHNLFFPGGTRSRSGALEKKLKLGLLGTGVLAYQNNLRNRKDRPKIFVVPCTLSYSLVLEAETLIEDSLKEAGKARYIITDDEFSKPGRILNFLRSIISLDSRIYVTFSEPLDPFGNRVLPDGTSVDHRGRPIDISGYVMSNGEVRADEARDAEYTRELGDAVMRTFAKDNTLLATHLLATVLFQMCKERHPKLDLYRMLRESALQSEGFPLIDVHTRTERLLAKLKKLVKEEKVRYGEERLGWDAQAVVSEGLKLFGVYHTTPAATRRGDRVFPSDPSLLLYYSNRTLPYGL